MLGHRHIYVGHLANLPLLDGGAGEVWVGSTRGTDLAATIASSDTWVGRRPRGLPMLSGIVGVDMMSNEVCNN